MTRDVLQQFLAEDRAKVELAAAKANIVGSFPLRLDTNRKILDNVAAIGFSACRSIISTPTRTRYARSRR